MAATSSLTILTLTDINDVKCPVCLDIFEDPVKISCSHVICKQCALDLERLCKQTKCPVCRQPFVGTASVHSRDKARLIKIYSANCEQCSGIFKISDLRAHSAVCQTPQVKAEQKFQPVAESTNKPPEDLPNRQTFTCPYCRQQNFDPKTLITHCNMHHKQRREKVVCPICVSMPWGDPNRKSADFIGHLNQRHKFEYETYVDYAEEDENETLRKVLADSMYLT